MQPAPLAYKSFGAIIKAFGGAVPFADAIGIATSHARTMLARDSIPPEYFADTADAARAAKINGVTHELLNRLVAKKRPPRILPGAEAVAR